MIPVFEPTIGEDEIAAVVHALRKGEISGSFGREIPQFEEEFAAYSDCKYGVAVSSGTAALHIAAAVAGIGAGDEVLVSASTNVATALAAYHLGAVPIPVDAEEQTWNLDIDLIELHTNDKTKAVMPVHLYGHPVDMNHLCEIARDNGLVVIEDCAEAHGATCHGRKVGSFGDMGCFSFYANKVITTGEGGMVVTNDATLADRLRLLRNLGFTKPRFRHEVPAYNYRLTGMQAAMGRVQLSHIEDVIREKRRVASLYNEYLRDIPGLRLPVEEPWARNVYWMYAIVVEPSFGLTRDQLAASLRESEIDTRSFFCPMNQQPFLSSILDGRNISCPVADRLWRDGLYLPSSLNLTEDQIEFIAASIRQTAAGADRQTSPPSKQRTSSLALPEVAHLSEPEA